jgi:branched-subunit amino acid transport protein
MTWLSIIIAGILTYFTRMTMITLVNRDMLGDKIKAVLEYVPSAVFPAIIFPAIFINDYGLFVEINDPKIFAAIVAVIVGYLSKNIIATISSGLVSYWFLIFVIFS